MSRSMQRPLLQIPVETRDRARGCLLAGAIGDALGAPVEFLSGSEIVRAHGPSGIRDLVEAYGRVGAITDDTQMTLFTAEGLMRAYVRHSTRGICHIPSVIDYAYRRWLYTQGISHPAHEHCLDGWLIIHRELFARRAPGNTCLASLQGDRPIGKPARNDSKGCGGVMRMAPIGMTILAQTDLSETFDRAVAAAALTHGHPTGQLTAGVLATVVQSLMVGLPLAQAVGRAQAILRLRAHHHETDNAVEAAMRLASERPNERAALETLGAGWVADEALAIGLYAAASAPSLESGMILAVNHGGDSDSTGSIAGNLLGAIHGATAIPQRWLRDLELREVIQDMADDLVSMPSWNMDDEGTEVDYWFKRYPGA